MNTCHQRLIASNIASDVAGALLATIQFFFYTLFSLATFWRGGREEGEKESAGDGEEGEKESAGKGREVERKKIKKNER